MLFEPFQGPPSKTHAPVESLATARLTRPSMDQGSLVVEVFDKNSKELVWIGIAENYKAHISDQTLMSRMISEVFKEFPN